MVSVQGSSGERSARSGIGTLILVLCLTFAVSGCAQTEAISAEEQAEGLATSGAAVGGDDLENFDTALNDAIILNLSDDVAEMDELDAEALEPIKK